jgi:hypothetical protein
MSIAETASTVTFTVAAEVTDGAVLPDQTVIEGFPVTAGLSKLDMVPDFLGNGGWILAQFTANGFKGLLFKQTLLNDDSFRLSQMLTIFHKYLLKRRCFRHHNFLKD